MAELVRANRVAVKANGEAFIADFYRTHKQILSVKSEDTKWEYTEENKVLARESFRKYVTDNAQEFGIDWKPEDMRDTANIRKAHYTTEEELITDAQVMVIPQLRALIEKCKYKIEWAGIAHEETTPMTKTSSGTDLTKLGIEDGKYAKSGNWAWATIKFVMTFKFKEEECYIPVTMELVSGQLKKPNLLITEFNKIVCEEIINAGLATDEELNPPKEDKKSKAKADAETEDK